jgi:hypothetical protein
LRQSRTGQMPTKVRSKNRNRGSIDGCAGDSSPEMAAWLTNLMSSAGT